MYRPRPLRAEGALGWIVRRPRKDGGCSHRVCWRDPSNTVKSKTFRRRRDAEAYLRSQEHSKDTGTYRDPDLGKVLLADFWDYYMRTSPPAAASTRSLYAMQARLYILPKLGNVRIGALTTPNVKEFLAELRSDGRGDATVASTYRLLRHLLNVAVRERRILENPASALQMPTRKTREMLFLTPLEVEDLAAAVPARYETLVYFLSYTGVRIGEAAALRVKHLDLLRGRARVEEASSEVDGRLVTGPTKTKQKRTVTMPRFLVNRLVAHLAAFSTPSDPNSLVFTSPRGQQLRQKAFRRRVIAPAASSLELPSSLRTHDLRHTAAAFAIKAGWHPKQLQEMLGHASIGVTFDVYGHLFTSLHEEGAARLDALYEEAASARAGEVVELRS
jgi:integrase